MLLMQPVNMVTVNCYIAETMSTCELFHFIVTNATADHPCTHEVHAIATFSSSNDLLARLKQSTLPDTSDGFELAFKQKKKV